MQLYKYTKIEYVSESIENGIYAGKISDFNDPYERDGIEYPEDYRVCCLTKSPKKMLLWAYYLNHNGCCMEFNIDVPNNIGREVEYLEDYYDKREMDNKEVFENLFTKAKEWNIENEYRIIYYANNDKSLWNNKNGKTFFKASPSLIVFGLRVNYKSQNVQSLLKCIKEYNEKNNNKIKVTKCLLSKKKYEIFFDKQFDYLREIITEEAAK